MNEKCKITITIENKEFSVKEINALAALIGFIPQEFNYELRVHKDGIKIIDTENLNNAPIITQDLCKKLCNT